MRVLFFESQPMWIYGLPNGFRDCGHKVLVSGPLNKKNIPEFISDFRPHLIISMGWTPEHAPEKVKLIGKYAKKAKIPLIYWATEDSTHTSTFSLPLIARMKPDFIFTISRKTLKLYESMGLKAAHLDFGFHKSVHCHVKRQSEYAGSIAVVANAYPSVLAKYKEHFRHSSLQTLIKPIIEKNIRVDFYGKNWDRMEPILGCPIPEEWLHGLLPYIDANKVYSSADIIIGLQNALDRVTQRTYEILGSGGFLLTSDTPEIRRIFKPGHDLVVSSSAEETLKLVSYYLNRPDEREKIRKSGSIAVKRHSYKYRAEYIIKVLKQHGII